MDKNTDIRKFIKSLPDKELSSLGSHVTRELSSRSKKPMNFELRDEIIDIAEDLENMVTEGFDLKVRSKELPYNINISAYGSFQLMEIDTLIRVINVDYDPGDVDIFIDTKSSKQAKALFSLVDEYVGIETIVSHAMDYVSFEELIEKELKKTKEFQTLEQLRTRASFEGWRDIVRSFNKGE